MDERIAPANEAHQASYTEAPASWNVKYILDGYDCMLTIRGESGSDLLPKTQAAIAWLKEHGAEPTRVSAPSLSNGNGSQKPAQAPTMPDGSPDPSWCQLHGVAMKRRESNGEVWFSHKAPDGSWCRGK